MRKATNIESGFSMLELLAVMSIGALLTTLAVTSYFSAVRGMGRRSAIKHLANTLTVARQRACMDNSRVSVVLFNEVVGYSDSNKALVSPSYVVCKEMGRVTHKGADKLVDEFTSLDSIFGVENKADEVRNNLKYSSSGGLKLYNLTAGGSSYVKPAVVKYPGYSGESPYDKGEKDYDFNFNVYAFELNLQGVGVSANWQTGDSYGIEASPVQNLPNGFVFEDLKDDVDKFKSITFLPTGRAQFKNNGRKIVIKETRKPGLSVTITVESDGQITYDNDWK